MDTITSQRIKKLHPLVREEVSTIITQCNQSLTGRSQVRITQGLRTFQQQEDLYAQGRTKPGKKVTNAKAGQSIHNYGLAVDICMLIDGKDISWDTTKDWDNDRIADCYECVKIFAKNGWDWGGNWKTFKDLPHFERRFIIIKSKQVKTSWRNLINLPKDKSGYSIL
ncbi:peptidoglycan L-alanyl-D-glutamate endopeptidase CwlK [Chryseobacterium defluvii]|uniref:Peptidoglycan L-alanyl-D-glutamate endopeptidase CwlK n=1 Tax=Chryseobacterium defluvii TaxID=160396 RepID=A0A840KFL3_9FLAO|nr:M15 family metallopeptidase [Chryseobacterium defluvii]MBB4807405.1 peptidoglycan L-alanyl-D-glutamate endopeptidase CwlK [Chryseobacterium defluvii]